MPVRPRADQVAKFVDVALTGGAFAAMRAGISGLNARLRSAVYLYINHSP